MSKVYYSNDPERMWLFAKMWFNLGDAMIHEILTHLGKIYHRKAGFLDLW